MIISGREDIYSREIEDMIIQHPAVLEVAVIGVPDEKWGESIKAIVSLKEGRKDYGRRNHQLLQRKIWPVIKSRNR